MKKAEVWIDTGDDPERKMKADLSSLIREDDNVQFKVTVQCLDPIAQVDKSVKALRRICKPLWSLVVWLGFNGLESIPDSIWELADNLEDLPAALCQLQQLEKLGMRANWLTEVPMPITKLVRLRQLDLSFNHFVSYPLLLGDLPRLVEFHGYGHALRGPCPPLIHLQKKRVIPRLSAIIASGFFCDQATSWPQFLFQGVYDPRLFLFIFDFAFQERSD